MCFHFRDVFSSSQKGTKPVPSKPELPDSALCFSEHALLKGPGGLLLVKGRPVKICKKSSSRT